MSEDRVVYFESRAAFRAWLEANYATASELEMGLYKKKTGRPSITAEEAIEEALCFGWVDSVRHAIDGESYQQRFTPRRPRSNWSRVNIERVKSLIERGLMTEAGLRAFENHDPERARYSYATRRDGLSPEFEVRLRANEAAWAFFTSQAPWYQRTASFWVMDAKREETRARRLETLIADSAAGRRIAPLTRPGERKARGERSRART